VNLLDSYAGPFEADFHLGRLTRAALGRLGREYMLFSHLHDRGIMPLVGRSIGPEAMTEVACDEWRGASPVYNQRNREQLGIEGDGVSAIFKGFQLDVGFPHQYMDVQYELVNESLGYFWLPFCGAYEDVFANSGGKELAIRQLCHAMEDTTFDATVMAVNPRARCIPQHRPPLQIGHTGPTCRWSVVIEAEAGKVAELDLTRRIRSSRAARFRFPDLEGELGEGRPDYRGPFEPDFVLESLAQPVLARQCKEFVLDVHLLMRAALTSIRDRWGAELADSMLRDHRAALAPVYVPRLRAALGIRGNDMASILKTLQIDPGLPPDYVRFGTRVIDGERGHFWIERCEALAKGEPEAWVALLEDVESPGFDATIAAVNPRARCTPVAPERIQDPRGDVERAWEIEIDESVEPLPESPLANVVRVSNAAAFSFRTRTSRAGAAACGPGAGPRLPCALPRSPRVAQGRRAPARVPLPEPVLDQHDALARAQLDPHQVGGKRHPKGGSQATSRRAVPEGDPRGLGAEVQRDGGALALVDALEGEHPVG
jgi:hypothetical protein